ncbi:MAG: 50S ribosomal protein L15 [Gammaproteobacteria bacterium]|nr:50S ribosomal protein L15 [Gammaproteobacteria bacterium]
MKINELRSPTGARKRNKIVGRGQGSGHGKTSCRGSKGQKSRSGEGKRPGFEGGQMPLIRRIPKRGFINRFRLEYQIVNLQGLSRIKENSIVSPKELFELGLIGKLNIPVKILGKGKLKKPITIKAHKFSKQAVKLIEEAGGKVEQIHA